MKKIIAVNGSPRTEWNTAKLIRKVEEGAASLGAEVKHYDLYRLDKFTGCISCFACKKDFSYGKCAVQDGMKELLEDIRTADGLIIGSPNYLSDITAETRAFYERLIFQSLTYEKDHYNANEHMIPVLFLMTSNAGEAMYGEEGIYTALMNKYKNMLERFVGPTETMYAADTLQVNDYSQYKWSIFDPEAKKAKHDTEFPLKEEEAYNAGRRLVG